jgi:hypothetical protein
MKRAVLFLPWLIIFVADCGSHPLKIAITAPVNGNEVTGVVGIRAEVEAEYEVRVVNFYLDDSLIAHFDHEPYSAAWNTFRWPDCTAHKIYARTADIADQEDVSDTVTVMIANDDLLFRDDFEAYVTATYPAPGGWLNIWPGVAESTYVDTLTAHAGATSFKLFGSFHYVRTDGVVLDQSGVVALVYELYIKIPTGSYNGTLTGFFIKTAPDTGTIVNGVMFDFNDHRISVCGIDPYFTDYSWQNGLWYKVRVALDFQNSVMSAWINDSAVVVNYPAAPQSLCDTFAVSTEYLGLGPVFIDDIAIRRIR